MRLIKKLVLREWRWIRKDKKQVLLAAIAPLVFVTILGLVYSPMKVVHVPILIVDMDHSALSREVTRGILSNETFSLGGYADSPADFPDLAAQDKAHMCFVFPHNFERDLKAGRQAKIQAILDGTNLLPAVVELGDAETVMGTYVIDTARKKAEAQSGITGTLAINRAYPIEAGTRIWFNPGFTSNYLNFLMVGILTIPIQLGGLLVSIGSGVSEYGERDAEPLSALTRNPWAIITGKVLTYVAIIYPVNMMLVYMPYLFFGAPMSGSQITLAFVTLWFTVMLVTLGYAFSCVLADPLQATEISALITLPNFLLSGFTWPIFAMPKILQPLAYGLPMYSFSFMYRKLSVMGASAADCLQQMAILGVWMLLALVLARYGTHLILKGKSEGESSNA
jgi:ABC-2 type transport system permease protein